ncbi:hypothetical protein PoB_000487300 [Plakobranchus ocellatus]|uniref:Uncharacterized protein n=1 Tax=Plakobranchus ocellatus TaxID=259542 RepID=A0AAV3Y861_9GAST|nr:hypothetical protein PoB_000487300 [Plakobranchus ocellatus]
MLEQENFDGSKNDARTREFQQHRERCVYKRTLTASRTMHVQEMLNGTEKNACTRELRRPKWKATPRKSGRGKQWQTPHDAVCQEQSGLYSWCPDAWTKHGTHFTLPSLFQTRYPNKKIQTGCPGFFVTSCHGYAVDDDDDDYGDANNAAGDSDEDDGNDNDEP